MSWLITEKADDGSRPVEAIPVSSPIRPFLRSSSRLQTEPVLRSTLSSQYSIHGVEAVGLFFIHVSNVQSILGVGFLNAGFKDTLVFLFVIKDALDFSGCLHRVIRLSRPLLQHAIADLFLETPHEHGFKH
jgi:hypothetical protein